MTSESPPSESLPPKSVRAETVHTESVRTETSGDARPPAPLSPRRLAQARFAVAILFFTNGAIFANLLPRYPEIVADLELSNAAFGVAVAAFPLGALLAGLSAGMLIRRFRSSRVAVVATIFTAVGILVAGVAPAWIALAGGLFLAGAMDSITDVAQNSHGLRVQRLYRRSILNSFHAIWSVGAVLGGVLGAAAAQFALPLPVHLSISGVVFSLMAMAAYRFLLAGPEPTEALSQATEDPADQSAPTAAATATAGIASSGITGTAGIASTSSAASTSATAGTTATPDVASTTGTAALRRPRALAVVAKYGVLLALVVIAASGALVEDSGSSWSAIYLSGSLGATAFVAGIGFIALQGMQFIGRIFGDRLVDRFGQRAVARAGGAIVFVGMGIALAFPSVPATVIGFGLAGLGVATLIPAAMEAADSLPGFRPGTGLTLVGWLLRVGFLVSPPIVGAIADATSLRTGLLIVPVAGLLVLLFARVLTVRVPAALPR
ncbi:MFS transporter [Glaciihabitans tibetensis]|uniref:MFS transporter n=1 Tax=Glaciihabitans tibetensis TaxID=1266600 RepID=A0A2T0VA84_9MICO|nr:MFS transporter [Glaciihabitans tibetensis]PRY67109.1 MFS transporter [Glaciihabitans tibetensis]